jgi:hypothetical protein
MIEFNKAIQIAKENVQSLISTARNIELEGVLISTDNKTIEVSLSYELDGVDPFGSVIDTDKRGELFHLAKMLRHRREYKVFLIDANTGQFRGFKNQENR